MVHLFICSLFSILWDTFGDKISAKKLGLLSFIYVKPKNLNTSSQSLSWDSRKDTLQNVEYPSLRKLRQAEEKQAHEKMGTNFIITQTNGTHCCWWIIHKWVRIEERKYHHKTCRIYIRETFQTYIKAAGHIAGLQLLMGQQGKLAEQDETYKRVHETSFEIHMSGCLFSHIHVN